MLRDNLGHCDMTSDCKNALQTHKPLYGCYSGMGPEWAHDHGLLIFSSQLGLKRTQRLRVLGHKGQFITAD